MVLVWIRFLCKRKTVDLYSGNKTVGCFNPRIENSNSVNISIIATHSLISVESLSYACLKSLEFADIWFI